ncbi:hypothetical protein BURPS1106B_A2506 [Burkholderia pseudomallei 1106b]|uniref:Uncharacterized protein n=1 Tax=Burkholderia pseudomallei (strain 1106a) TaxID=357348 RepID=A3NYV7_BURP0|nr:hypothetical protein BURPS1106A_3290 [Burkholderia pseudomallei 1106a]EES25509.1 hypothetical protein BURPS1106B_A2506 [Burkholderia pseudomallei 1106b]
MLNIDLRQACAASLNIAFLLPIDDVSHAKTRAESLSDRMAKKPRSLSTARARLP